jgi:hypothetical protein
MDIEKELQDKIARMTDINKQLMEIQKKIGTLQEEGKAVYNAGLQLKGAIDFLLQKQAEEKEALAQSATAKLTLPVGVKPIIAETTMEKAVSEDLQRLDAEVPEKPVDPIVTEIPGPEATPTLEVK